MDCHAFTFADPQQGHVAIRRAPRCLDCGNRTIKGYCKPGNENGNGSRPYYFCSCGKFACFGDMRGVLQENPTCCCDHGMQSSRRVIASREVARAKVPRSISYQCATGGCEFFEYMRDNDGRVVVYDGPILPGLLTRLGF